MPPTVTKEPIEVADDLDATAALWADREPDARRRLLLGALAAFASHGYSASTTRQIADAAGMSSAALYVYYDSKSEILGEIARTGHASVLNECRLGLADGDSSTERVRAFVARFATWHANHHTLARVTQYEWRSLEPDDRKTIKRLRDEIEKLLASELEAGVESGEFEVTDLDGTVIALLSMCIDVARWYSPHRREKPSAIGDLYADLAIRMTRA
jgi:AcrR family transcriptional regulator